VVEVAMGEDDAVELAEVVWDGCVDLVRDIAVSLIEAEVEEDAGGVGFDDVAGAGDGAVGPVELDAHGEW
jgi:hypothetical protein